MLWLYHSFPEILTGSNYLTAVFCNSVTLTAVTDKDALIFVYLSTVSPFTDTSALFFFYLVACRSFDSMQTETGALFFIYLVPTVSVHRRQRTFLLLSGRGSPHPQTQVQFPFFVCLPDFRLSQWDSQNWQSCDNVCHPAWPFPPWDHPSPVLSQSLPLLNPLLLTLPASIVIL